MGECRGHSGDERRCASEGETDRERVADEARNQGAGEAARSEQREVSRGRAAIHLGIGGEERQRAGPEEHARSEGDCRRRDEGAQRGPLQRADGGQRSQQRWAAAKEESAGQEQRQEGEQVAKLVEQRPPESQLRISGRSPQAESHRVVCPQHRARIPRRAPGGS